MSPLVKTVQVDNISIETIETWDINLEQLVELFRRVTLSWRAFEKQNNDVHQYSHTHVKTSEHRREL